MRQMINLPAKDFPLDVKLLMQQFAEITPKIESISPCDGYYVVAFAEVLDDEEMRAVKIFWAGKEIDEAEHAAALKKNSRKSPSALATLYENKKRDSIKKDYADLSELERKVLFGIPLTDDELDSL